MIDKGCNSREFTKSEDPMLINFIPMRLKKYTFENIRPISNIMPSIL